MRLRQQGIPRSPRHDGSRADEGGPSRRPVAAAYAGAEEASREAASVGLGLVVSGAMYMDRIAREVMPLVRATLPAR